MGKHLYLGPYVECTYKKATRTDHVVGCSAAECKKHPKKVGPNAEGQFCSACGAPNTKIPIEVADRTDRYEVVGDELFDLHSEKHQDVLWLAPNVRRKGDPRPKFDDSGELHLDLQGNDRVAEMDWLEKAFAPELKKLREAYATVTLKWGLHQYFM